MPVAQRLAGNSIAVFAATRDGTTAWRTLTRIGEEQAWSGWENVGPAVSGRPVVCQNMDGRLEIFGRGADGRLWHSWQTHDEHFHEWEQWETLGPRIVGNPAATRNRMGRLEVFAIDDQGTLGHAWQRDVGGWSDWHPLALETVGTPAVIANANGLLVVLAIDARGWLGYVRQVEVGPAALSWSGWQALAGPLQGPPAPGRNLDGHIETLVKSPEGHLGNLWQSGRDGAGGWSGWNDLGAQLDGEPLVASNIDGRLEVFGRGTDGTLGHLWQTEPNGADGWSQWESVGPRVDSEPAVALNPSGELDVYAVGADGRLGHVSQHRAGASTLGWHEWEDLGPVAKGAIPAVATISGIRAGVEPPPRTNGGSRARGVEHVSGDVCVIGAGPAGIALSEMLVGAGLQVVQIESGGLQPDPSAERLNRGAAHGPIIKGYWRYLMDGRRRGVGGSASIWGPGICIPFSPIDFAPRAWVDATGWPFGRDELAPFEREAAEFFGFEPFEAPEPDGNLVRLRYRNPPDPQPWRRVFHRLADEPNFRAELGCTALEFSTSGDRIESVRGGRFDGSEVEISAGTFVLAAGGVENARFLLLNEHVLPTLSAMAGRCFMEHPHALAARIQLPNAPELDGVFGGGTERELFALRDAAQEEEGLLLASVEVRPHRKERPGPGEPMGCDLYVRSEQAPYLESSVSLGASQRDHFGLRPVLLNWRLQPIDWHSVVRTAELVAMELGHRYDTRAELVITDEMRWPGMPASPTSPGNATWGNHHMGTTRMADSPQDGVVDRDCRVHGIENLYVAGSSVFPTGSCANPTFMIITLTKRLGAHLTGVSVPVAAPANAG
jgi:hypothetical protein